MSRKQGSASLGLVDSSFFPEISNETSKYKSPLIPILMDLKRKHVVAAAATSGPDMSLNDSSDPWSNTEDHDDETGILFPSSSCNCYLNRKKLGRRRSSLFKGPKNNLMLSPEDICTTCGKRRPFDPIGNVAAYQKHATRLGASNDPNTSLAAASGPPRHAQSLLHSTPHLRHLSAGSADMQGAGTLNSNRGLLGMLLPNTNQTTQNNIDTNISSSTFRTSVDYRSSLTRQQANMQAATELASFLWVLAHEMSLDNYGYVENEVFTNIFALVHSNDGSSRMAGIVALNSLIEAPSADEEKKAIKFANNLSNSLRSQFGDYEFLSAVSRALGHMAIRATNVDFVESEITRALEWLRSDRSARRCVRRIEILSTQLHCL